MSVARSALILLLVATAACTTQGVSTSPPERPVLNPDGSPWGPPPNPEAEPWMVVTPWGVALVHDRGYPRVHRLEIEDVFYRAAAVCEPDPGAFAVQVYIEPTLFQIEGRWSAGVTAGTQIWVVGHYESWDGRIARYDELLFRELVDHLLDCGDPAEAP